MRKLTIFIIISLLLNTMYSTISFATQEKTTRYTIQIGVFKNKMNADKIYTKLTQNGYNTYTVKNGSIIQVYVGNYKTKNEATNVLAKLKKLEIVGIIKTTQSNIQILDTKSKQKPKTTTSVNNHTNYSQVYTKNHRLNQDALIEGVYGSHLFFFEINSHWKMENDHFFELIFSQSDIEKYNRSSLTVYINNQPIYSTLLQTKKRNRKVVRIPIPKESINEGFNEVKIRTYHRISEKPCVDEVNPANWIVFHKESYIHLSYRKELDKNDLRDYPYPYLKQNEDFPINCKIIIPDNFTHKDLQAAMLLSANFGQRQALKKLDISVSKYRDIKDKDENNIIYIGSINTLPKEFMNLLSDYEKSRTKKEALLKEIYSPYNKNFKLLLILSDDKKSMINAVKTLSLKQMVLQMEKNTQFIPSTLDTSTPQKEHSNYIHLKDLGYNDIFIEGLFNQKTRFSISTPKNWIVEDGAKLVFKMRYSEVLNFDKSMMTIYLNEIPIGSKRLSAENANNDIFEIKIPKEALDHDYYDLKIHFYLDLKDINCDTRLDSNSWVYLSKESHFYLPHKNRNDSFFEYYSNPFIKDHKFNNSLMVLSNKPSSEELTIAANIVSFLAREADDLNHIDFITADQFNAKSNDKNLIVIGLLKQNSLIDYMGEHLHIKLNKEGTKFVSNDKIVLLEGYNSKVASIQLIDSPYKKGKKALIITSTLKEGLGWAKEYLTDDALLEKLKGNATIINEVGNVLSAYYGVYTKDGAPINENIKKTNLPKDLSKSQIKYYIIFLVTVFMLILLSSIFLIRRKR